MSNISKNVSYLICMDGDNNDIMQILYHTMLFLIISKNIIAVVYKKVKMVQY